MYLDKHVKILLQSNFIVEGIVKEWSDTQVCIESAEDNSLNVVLHPKEDIRVVKILNYETSSHKIAEELDSIPEKPKEPISELQQKFEEAYQAPSDNELRLKNLAELKADLIKQEKEIIASKLKNHTIGEVKTVKYELPGFLKK